MIELLNFLDITVERGVKIGMSPEISPPPRVGFLFGWCNLGGQFRSAARKPAYIKGLRAFFCLKFQANFYRSETPKKANQKDSNSRHLRRDAYEMERTA